MPMPIVSMLNVANVNANANADANVNIDVNVPPCSCRCTVAVTEAVHYPGYATVNACFWACGCTFSHKQHVGQSCPANFDAVVTWPQGFKYLQ